MEHALDWIAAHGCAAVFGLLAAGLTGVPVPDELLLAFTGTLAARGTLGFLPALLAASGGSLLGASVNYAVGRLAGAKALSWLAARSRRLDAEIARARGWFRRRGAWCLVPCFFVPGVRHAVAVLAGASGLSPWVFCASAGAGALLWCGVFMAGGYAAWARWRPIGRARPVC